MLSIAIILTAHALAAWFLHALIKSRGQIDASWWQPLTMLATARLFSRGIPPVLPNADAFTKLGAGFILYLTVITAMLIFWTRVPPLRALPAAAVCAIGLFVAGIVAVFLLPGPASAAN